MSEQKNFYQQVFALLEQVPAGKVTTYGQIARRLGRPRGAQLVGWAIRYCPDGLPWHRVVKADGSIACGEWGELADMRKELLKDEVGFLENGNVDMDAHLMQEWDWEYS